MSFNDPIAELLTKIRNAKDALLPTTEVFTSRIKLQILQHLKEHGFIADYQVIDRKVRVYLKYTKTRDSVIRGLKRVSTPGLRRYVSYQDIPKVANGMGIALVSTSKGGILEGEKARQLRVGGEIICIIW
jgi:small subunit ribosomal protein S8